MLSLKTHKIKSSHKKQKNKIKNSLQAQKKTNYSAYTDDIKTLNSKRVSPILFPCISGGVSVEAALAVPLFLFFMINMISIISIFSEYSMQVSKVQQEARSLSFMCNDISDAGSDTVTSMRTVKVNSMFSIVGFKSSPALASMTYKKWNGYHLGGSNENINEEEYVYITEHGYSYHRNRDCSHLKITIESATNEDIVNKRNSSGKKYYACEKCGGNGSGILFYTPDGDKYHSNSGCSGLKRNVKTVKLSEVNGRSPCGDCGGK